MNMRITEEAYQKAHLDWMRDRQGSDLTDVFVVAIIAPLAVFALKLARCSNSFLRSHAGSLSLGRWLFQFLLEYGLVIVPQLVIVICPSIHNNLSIVGLFMCGAVLFIFIKSAFKYAKYADLGGENEDSIESAVQSSSTSIVTCFRAGTLLMTVICILAVDFPAFPVRFAKTETYGVSLMDSGVGMFVVANAVVAPEVHRSSSSLVKSLKSSGPLFVLGFGRLSVLKLIGYHDNPAEYGTCWNFFFTLGLIRVFATMVMKIGGPGSRNRRISWALSAAVLIMFSYQLLLSEFGLSSYILGMESLASESTSLINIWHNNRGGIASCFGFLALYLVGVAFGCIIFAEIKRKLRQTLSLVFVLFGISMLMLPFLFASWTYIEPPSRRLANLSYVLYVIMLASCLLGLVLALDLCIACLSYKGKATRALYKVPSPPFILEAINRQGLAVFLLANVLTGAVNLSLATIYASTWTCVSVMMLYTLCVTMAACLWHRRQSTTKSI